MHTQIRQALKTFELDQYYDKIHTDPNQLIEAGFPASFLLPLVKVFRSNEACMYFHEGKIVNELIGIRHLSLIRAIGEHIGIPTDAGSGFTGRGFVMRAVIDAIYKTLNEQQIRD